ncbi:RNA polymerase sigma factor [Polyangium sp. y55x31]|uniref:RNA polymerase sigma factor n=1 Tax=Polyangium sp. y55x31 TaxID=3042688 RepID=UPI002482CDA8|nr:RNA polymerase sigma factor [Polyangium sp. y55x31]MDI1481226.1 RNA polymerase sigma factor [Polyangium sp. y55x31]
MLGRQSIEQVYRAHGHSVLRRAARLLGNEADAREALQEVFASLLERPEQFQGTSSLTTWLYSATTNLCLNKLRDGKTRSRLLHERVAPARADAVPPSAEASALVRDLLAKLPEDLATAAVYYYLDDMTHEEIAAVMGCSRRHVGNLLDRLKTWAASHEEGEPCDLS